MQGQTIEMQGQTIEELKRSVTDLKRRLVRHDNYSGDHKFVQNNAAFLLANLSMSKVNLAVL